MRNIEWIFFDVGSTLVDESKAYEHRLRDAIAGTGISYGQAYRQASDLARQNIAEPIKRLGLALTPWHKEDEFIDPQAKDCLCALHGAYKIGVIANQSPGTAGRMKRYGVYDYLDLIIASAEEGVAKPDLEIFRLALTRSACPPEHAVMIGDRLDNDIIPAKQLGMKTIWMRRGFGGMATPRSEKETPDFCINELSELRGLFNV